MDDIAQNEFDADRTRNIARTALEAVGLDNDEEGIADLITNLMHLADTYHDSDGWSVWRSAERHYKAERPSEDESNLDKAKQLARETVPSAAFMLLESSDQSNYGFGLTGLKDADGNDIVLTTEQETALDNMYDFLCDLDWNGAVGEDRSGYARIALNEAEEKN